ncbi:MAG: hypothetical protein AAB474_00115 [Patescibacteria group bacterium]
MFNLADLLKKFEPIRSHKKNIEKEAADWCRKQISDKFTDFEIKFKYPILTISSENMAMKNFLFLHQEKLLRFLQEKFGKKAPSQVLFK